MAGWQSCWELAWEILSGIYSVSVTFHLGDFRSMT